MTNMEPNIIMTITGQHRLDFIHAYGNGGGNIAPELYLEIYNDASNGNITDLPLLQSKIIRINSLLTEYGSHDSRYIKGLKAYLKITGVIDSDFIAEPFHKFKNPEYEKIKLNVKKIGDNK